MTLGGAGAGAEGAMVVASISAHIERTSEAYCTAVEHTEHTAQRTSGQVRSGQASEGAEE
jgi:hypothetical protein